VLLNLEEVKNWLDDNSSTWPWLRSNGPFYLRDGRFYSSWGQSGNFLLVLIGTDSSNVQLHVEEQRKKLKTDDY